MCSIASREVTKHKKCNKKEQASVHGERTRRETKLDKEKTGKGNGQGIYKEKEKCQRIKCDQQADFRSFEFSSFDFRFLIFESRCPFSRLSKNYASQFSSQEILYP
jgi:hypothetical protein